MFIAQAGPLTQGPVGLLEPTGRPQPAPAQLRPWALLQRLRPVKIETLTTGLQRYERTVTALRRLEKFFPEALDEYTDLANTGWWEILAHLVSLVEEAGWWETDWDILNEAWAYWMQEPEDPKGGDRMATFLDYIPARDYGFTQETILAYPPMELLSVLLDSSTGVASSDLLAAIELYDGINDWSEADRTEVWDRLHAIEADPGLYPEPIRWLPELARWACHRTGNHLLDRPAMALRAGLNEDGPWLSWESEFEVEQVKSAWRRAQPVIGQFRRLMKWYEADPSRITLLANFLMEGINREQLDW